MKFVVALILFCTTTQFVKSVPYFVLNDRASKCFSFNVARNTLITFSYHFPDVIVMSEDMTDPNDIKEVMEEDKNMAPDELSKRYNERYKRKMAMMAKMGRHLNDVSIAIFQNMDSPVNARNRRHREIESRDRGTMRLREVIKEKHGNVTFISSPGDDAPVEFCIQCTSCSPKMPSRFSIKIEMEPFVDPAIAAAQHAEEIHETVSVIEGELRSLERKIEMIMRNAETAKEQEISVHGRSITISRASVYWPLFHIAIVIVASYSQATHVANFFKKHHIV